MGVSWEVTRVEVIEPFRLHVVFADGLEGEVEFGFFTGVFEGLSDPKAFARVAAPNGFVTWPGELDLAPDAMHAEIVRRGVWKVS